MEVAHWRTGAGLAAVVVLVSVAVAVVIVVVVADVGDAGGDVVIANDGVDAHVDCWR